MKLHDPDSYQIVILSRYMSHAAVDLYNAASRGESISYDLAQVKAHLSEVTGLINQFNANKGS